MLETETSLDPLSEMAALPGTPSRVSVRICAEEPGEETPHGCCETGWLPRSGFGVIGKKASFKKKELGKLQGGGGRGNELVFTTPLM